jgi:hypothetical protein
VIARPPRAILDFGAGPGLKSRQGKVPKSLDAWFDLHAEVMQDFK